MGEVQHSPALVVAFAMSEEAAHEQLVNCPANLLSLQVQSLTHVLRKSADDRIRTVQPQQAG